MSIPPSIPTPPLWSPHTFACTPDGDLVYASGPCLVLISNPKGSTPTIKHINLRQRITYLAVDPEWGKSHRYVATTSDDKKVLISDFNEDHAVLGHDGHVNHGRHNEDNAMTDMTVVLQFTCNRKLLSINRNGGILYCLVSNSYVTVKIPNPFRRTYKTLSCSPFDENIYALGTQTGHVLVCDLKKTTVLYNLSYDYKKSIMCIKWALRTRPVMQLQAIVSAKQNCTESGRKETVTDLTEKQSPSPKEAITDLTKKPSPSPKEMVEMKQEEISETLHIPDNNDEIFDTYNYDYLEDEFGVASSNEQRRNRNDSTDECEFVGTEKPRVTEFNFDEECQNLKETIAAMKLDPIASEEQCEVTLSDCQEKQLSTENPLCLSEYESQGSQRSVELSNPSVSEDDGEADVIGAEQKKEILHQAVVHTMPMQEQQNLNSSNEAAKLIKLSKEGSKSAASLSCDCNKENYALHVCESNVQEKLSQQQQKQNVIDLGVQEDKNVFLAAITVEHHLVVYNLTEGGRIVTSLKRPGHKAKEHLMSYSAGFEWLDDGQSFIFNNSSYVTFYTLEPGTENVNKSHKAVKQRRLHQAKAFAYCKEQNLVWTYTHSCEILCIDLNSKTREILAKYHTAPYNITDVKVCPDDMNKIALAFYDKRIGILDLSRLSSTKLHIDYHSIKDEGNAIIEWSPDGTKLAYGTEHGKVGVLSMETKRSENHFRYKPGFAKQIYSLSWLDNNLFIVCNALLGVYASNKKGPPQLYDFRRVSRVSARGKYLFVGFLSGNIELHCRQGNDIMNYKFVQRFNLSPRCITGISWSSVAPEQLAVVGRSSELFIFKFFEEQGNLVLKRTLTGKGDKDLLSVQWSNCNKATLITAGNGGVAQIWKLNAANDDNQAKYLKHFNSPLHTAWLLPTDEDVFICTGRQLPLNFVDTRIQPSEEPYNAKCKISHPLHYVCWAQKLDRQNKKKGDILKRSERNAAAPSVFAGQFVTTTSVGGNAVVHVESEAASGVTDAIVTAVGYAGEVPQENVIEKCDESVSQVKSCEAITGEFDFMNKQELHGSNLIPKTLLSKCKRQLNTNADCILSKYVIGFYDEQPADTPLIVKLFKNAENAKEVLRDEIEKLRNSRPIIANNQYYPLFYPIVNGNLKEVLLERINKQQLTEEDLALAPSVSHVFWRKCCEAYATQLRNLGHDLLSATYLLAIHNESTAIEQLIKAKYFCEAYLIAQVYLQKDDPMLQNIIDTWTNYLKGCGAFNTAALICALNGEYERVYDLLRLIRTPSEKTMGVLKILSRGKDHHEDELEDEESVEKTTVQIGEEPIDDSISVDSDEWEDEDTKSQPSADENHDETESDVESTSNTASNTYNDDDVHSSNSNLEEKTLNESEHNEHDGDASNLILPKADDAVQVVDQNQSEDENKCLKQPTEGCQLILENEEEKVEDASKGSV